MSDEQKSAKRPSSLDERFADDPLLRERLHQIADMRDQLLAQGASLDEVEAQTVGQIRMLGLELLQSLGQAQADRIVNKALQQTPSAIKYRKKK